MASTGRNSLKSTLRQSHANYFDNLLDSMPTLADGGVMAAGSVLGIGIQAVQQQVVTNQMVVQSAQQVEHLLMLQVRTTQNV